MSVNRSGLYIGLMVIAAAVAGYMVSRQLARDARASAPTLQSGTLLQMPRLVQAFSLTDHRGATFDNARLTGRPALVFFGFTHCPDVCPTTLVLLAQLQRDTRLKDLQLLFVTVDPARDDLQTLQHYVDAFGGGLVGLRGEDAALDPLLLNLGAARSRQPLVGSDYAVDHSANLHYINDRGKFSAVFTPPLDLGRLRSDLIALVDSRY